MKEAFETMLSKYDINTSEDAHEALREILQEFVLYALSQTNFFEKAVFYGGTALRILHKLPRFSEDLDFSLIQKDENFDIKKYENSIKEYLLIYGLEIEFDTKVKDSNIKSAFIKGNTIQHLINIGIPQDLVYKFHPDKKVVIKFEVDIMPPLDFEITSEYLLQPIPFEIKAMTIPSLYAGKMHAILCRAWGTRPKGRDWYDLIWYIKQGHKLDLKHLEARLRQSCLWAKNSNINLPKTFTKDTILELLQKRIEDTDFEKAKNDVKSFVKNENELNIWNNIFFKAIINQIKFQ